MISNNQKNWIASHLFGREGTVPAKYYVGLLLAVPTADQSTPVAEVTTIGTGYARIEFDNDNGVGGALTAATNGIVTNLSEISFAPVGETDYGTVVAVGLFTSQAGGVPIYWSVMSTPKSYTTGDVAFFLSGGIRFQVDEIAD